MFILNSPRKTKTKYFILVALCEMRPPILLFKLLYAITTLILVCGLVLLLISPHAADTHRVALSEICDAEQASTKCHTILFNKIVNISFLKLFLNFKYLLFKIHTCSVLNFYLLTPNGFAFFRIIRAINYRDNAVKRKSTSVFKNTN